MEKFKGKKIGRKILLVIIGLVIVVQLIKPDKYDIQFHEYTVMPNDTIWSIASDIRYDIEQQGGKYDIRNIVFGIKEINGCKDNIIAVGETILIPEYTKK